MRGLVDRKIAVVLWLVIAILFVLFVFFFMDASKSLRRKVLLNCYVLYRHYIEP